MTKTSYLYDINGAYYEGDETRHYFASSGSEAEFLDRLKRANGSFSVQIKLGETIFAAVDRYRSTPLFYRPEDPQKRIASTARELGRLSQDILKQAPSLALAEYLATGYTTEDSTLHPAIKQIPAGHYLCWEAAKPPRIVEYYSFRPDSTLADDPDILCEQLDDIHNQLARRLIRSLDGRTVLLPLSGGWDSRLIAHILKRQGYEKLICFSYGSPGNPESLLSQRAAQELGYRWIFIPHNRRLWYRSYHSPERNDYFAQSFNYCSCPHTQDWLAVKYLKDKGLIPEDSVFVPGHAADFLEGSHLSPALPELDTISPAYLVNSLIKRHYSLWNWQDGGYRALFTDHLLSEINPPATMNPALAAGILESWDLRERLGKFIFNSLRVYEYYGYQWRLPLMDTALMDFWEAVPLHLRVNRKLWHDYAVRYLPTNVEIFSKPGLSDRLTSRILKSFIGDLTDIRYGRFLDPSNPLDTIKAKVSSLLLKGVNYPDFVDPEASIQMCNLNALQSVLALKEALED
jgi:asparagine synthase (glutamine-hydrolysing)